MPSLDDRAVAYLKDKIVSGQLKPYQALSEASIAKELGISRTPVRIALARLKERGYIRESEQGLFVAGASVDDMRGAFLAREALEGLAAREAAAARPEALISELYENVRKYETITTEGADLHQAMAADHEFHMTLVQAAGSRRIEQYVRECSEYIHRFRYLSAERPMRPREVAAEHRAIVDGIRQGDGEAAEAAVRLHLQRARHHLLQLVETFLVPLYGNNF